tara:strand:- start:832 stop:2643 length:1812 start_codon:yes stop_codon:yes gene_type:complete
MSNTSAYWLKNTRDLKEKFNLIELANTQRAISNFVKIMTGDEIPVEFYSNNDGDSMTNGKNITISSLINERNMDSIVGLALHESAHCKYTDFDVLKKINNVLAPQDLLAGRAFIEIFLNFIEDRRIDSLVYKAAPGYQGYYNSMYKRYFYNDIVDKGLRGNNYREEEWESYLFRIINIFNKNTDLQALHMLENVYNIIDLKNIDRLKNTKDSLDVAIQIYKLLVLHFAYFKDIKFEPKNKKEINYKEGNKDSPSKEKIKYAFRKQEEFLKGNTKKSSTTKKDKLQLNAICNSKISVKNVEVGGEFNPNFDVHVVDGISNSMINANLYGIFNSMNWREQDINQGLQIGKKLLRTLKIRNEQVTLDSHRLKKGKIDPRRIFAAEYVDDIFKKTDRSSFKPISLHVSIDGSGSMKGQKWTNTLINTIALGYISLNMDNIDLTISIRTSGGIGLNNTVPLLILAFDSKKHTIDDLKKLGYVESVGLTPEGICFEVLKEYIPSSSYYLDSYLINMSDGYPMFRSQKTHSYKGKPAIAHTSKVIRSIKNNGVNILSYFITTDTTDIKLSELMEDFRTMYGKSASFIDPQNIPEITKTLNKLFLTKNMIS